VAVGVPLSAYALKPGRPSGADKPKQSEKKRRRANCACMAARTSVQHMERNSHCGNKSNCDGVNLTDHRAKRKRGYFSTGREVICSATKASARFQASSVSPLKVSSRSKTNFSVFKSTAWILAHWMSVLIL
jgi:hypothetical protein